MAPKREIIAEHTQHSFVFKTHSYPYALCVWHQHPEIEIHLIRHATGQYVVGDHVGDFVHGHLVLTGPNLPHNWYSVEFNKPHMPPQKDFVIQVHPEVLEQMLGDVPEARGIRDLIATSERGYEFHGPSRERAEHLIAKMEDADGFLRVTLLLELLHVLAACDEKMRLASPNFELQQRTSIETQFEAMRALIRKNFNSTLSQADMAKRFNMRPETFSRFFKKRFGSSFVRYLNAVRVGEACKLLMEEEATIAEIAFTVGFNNISNFNRRFIEVKSITPREYRALSKARLGRSINESPVLADFQRAAVK